MFSVKVLLCATLVVACVIARRYEHSRTGRPPSGFQPGLIHYVADSVPEQTVYHKPKHSEEGGGQEHRKGYNEERGQKGEKGHEEHEYHDKSKKVKKKKQHEKGRKAEDGGSKKEHYDEAGHHAEQHEAKKSHKGAKFGEKKGHKRGHKTKGYHNKFFKDEYVKEHKFYDDFHKSGEYSKYGSAHSGHENKEGGHKKGSNHKSKYNDDHYGKKDHKVKGHLIDKHKGHDFKQGDEAHHDHHESHGKKGASAGGSYYGFNRKH